MEMVESEQVCTIPDILGVITAVDYLTTFILRHVRNEDSLPGLSDRSGALLKSLCMKDEASIYIFHDFAHIPFSLRVKNEQFIPVARVGLDEAEGAVYIALEEYRHPTAGLSGEFIYTFPFIYADAMPLGGDIYRMIGVNVRVAVYPREQDVVVAEVVLGFYDFSRGTAKVIKGLRVIDRTTIINEGQGLTIYRCPFHEVSCLSSIEWNVVDVFRVLNEIEEAPTEL